MLRTFSANSNPSTSSIIISETIRSNFFFIQFIVSVVGAKAARHFKALSYQKFAHRIIKLFKNLFNIGLLYLNKKGGITMKKPVVILSIIGGVLAIAATILAVILKNSKI